MAEPRMNASDLRCKKEVLDEFHQDFEKKLAVFAQQVKTKMETTSAEVANKCFKKALFFFALPFPNIEDTEQAYMESEEGRLHFDAKLKEIEAKLEAKFEDRLRDNEKSHISTFKVRSRDDKPLLIWDVKFVSSSLLLVASENCVKLFNIEGQELDTLKCQKEPWSLAILTEKAHNCWSVAVTLHSSIGLVEINEQTLSMKSVINTQKKYHIIAAQNSTTLAAGYFNGCAVLDCGVDLISTSGNVLRSICSNVSPSCMVTTGDQCLIVLDGIKRTFNKFNLRQGTHDINPYFSEIRIPRSIARLQSDSFVVADNEQKVLHLVGHDGQYKRVLCKLPSGGYFLSCMTIKNNVCLCGTHNGFVYVFNVQGDQIE